MTTIKTKIDPKTGDILRTTKETIVTFEVVDSKTGKVKQRVVKGELPFRTSRANTPRAKRQAFIEKITQLVNDLEISYSAGNMMIECLKNFKINPRVKKRTQKYFIPDQTKIQIRYGQKYGDQLALTPNVLNNQISILREILQVINSLDLLPHWESKLKEKFDSYLSLKRHHKW